MKNDLPSINYDDFYKFVTSFSVITFIFGITGATIILSSPPQYWTYYTGSFSFMIIAIISVISFTWAVKKWKVNQEKLDTQLDAETSLKLLQLRKEAAEYEKQIEELAKEQHPFPQFDFLNNLSRHHARSRVERT